MKYYTGVAKDPRTKEEKKKDWNAKELLGFAPVVEWKEKKEWKSFTPRNQKSTSSCVPQSISKILEVNEKKETGKTIVFSASKPYADRTNEGEGSYLYEMLKYAVEGKYTTEDNIQSQNLNSDNEMSEKARNWSERDTKIGLKYSGKSYLLIDLNMDTIAYWVSQGYGVSALFYFNSKEWSPKYPVIKDKSLTRDRALCHAVSVVDFGLISKKKFLKIEDSAHFGGRVERWISEDFFKRCFGAGFIFDKPNEEPISIPHEFTKIMTFGQTSTEIKFLQERLKVEGYFPLNIPSSGFFGEITRQAVEKYQRDNKVASEWELNLVKGKIVGKKSIQALNLGI
jgi:hypothetical protein